MNDDYLNKLLVECYRVIHETTSEDMTLNAFDVRSMAEELEAARSALKTLVNLDIGMHYSGSIYHPSLKKFQSIHEGSCKLLNPAIEFFKMFPLEEEPKK